TRTTRAKPSGAGYPALPGRSRQPLEGAGPQTLRG
ncbi:MAG: hypothetical protein RLZZ598_1419, partial [Pseudomonadota bacterium]